MSNETQQKQGFEIHPPGWRQADDAQEQWNRVHAQLLKSVADAQAKLLAGINVLEDRLNEPFKVGPKLDSWLEGINDRLGLITGRLDAIGAILAELLTVRRPVARPAKRKQHR